MVRTSVHDTNGCTSCDLLLNKCRETWNRFVTWINSFFDQCHFSLILKTLDSSLSNCSCVVRRSRRITSSSARTVSPSKTRPLLMTSSAKKKNRNLKTAFIVPWYNVKHWSYQKILAVLNSHCDHSTNWIYHHRLFYSQSFSLCSRIYKK